MINFSTRAPQVENWPRRVADYLAAMPPSTFTRDDDWAIMQRVAMGQGQPSYAHTARAQALLRAARDDNGGVTIDGQAALMRAVRP